MGDMRIMWCKDITGVEKKKKGTFRSLNGAADESIFQGRASKAGFYCFFKVWRDMPYDAVLDYKGVLYRVEVKGSSNNSFNVTRGTRSGKQIIKTPGSSRTKVLSRDDCDFTVGVDSNTGDCYIIPEDVIEVIGTQNLSTAILSDFKEKWGLFVFQSTPNILTKEQTRDGLLKLSNAELYSIIAKLGVVVPPGNISLGKMKKQLSANKDKLVYTIWSTIAQRL